MRVKSSHDMLGIVAELNFRRIPKVLGRTSKLAGGHLQLTPQQLGWLHTARALHHRYSLGDLRHEPSEADAIRDLCAWLVSEHRRHQGTDDNRPIDWDHAGLVATANTNPQPKAYGEIVGKIRGGDFDGVPSL